MFFWLLYEHPVAISLHNSLIQNFLCLYHVYSAITSASTCLCIQRSEFQLLTTYQKCLTEMHFIAGNLKNISDMLQKRALI